MIGEVGEDLVALRKVLGMLMDEGVHDMCGGTDKFELFARVLAAEPQDESGPGKGAPGHAVVGHTQRAGQNSDLTLGEARDWFHNLELVVQKAPRGLVMCLLGDDLMELSPLRYHVYVAHSHEVSQDVEVEISKSVSPLAASLLPLQRLVKSLPLIDYFDTQTRGLQVRDRCRRLVLSKEPGVDHQVRAIRARRAQQYGRGRRVHPAGDGD